MNLTQQAIDTFHRNGWMVIENVLSPEEVAALNQRSDEIILGEKYPDVSERCIQIEPDVQARIESGEVSRLDAVRTLRGVVPYDDLFQAHMRNANILDAAEALVGPDVCFHGDLLFNKPAKYGSEKPWHQDNASLEVEPASSLVGCWVALDDADVENGCMRFLPGSHTWGLLPHVRDRFGTCVDLPVLVEELRRRNLVAPAAGRDAATDEELREVVRMAEIAQPLRAGSCLFQHNLVLHNTAPNRSQRRRRSLTTWYVNAHSRHAAHPDIKPDWPLVRGQGTAEGQ
jgi:ectoine hydroxylase-related dioxygenase (phytanoyl-CoA dioxygenase family)